MGGVALRLWRETHAPPETECVGGAWGSRCRGGSGSRPGSNLIVSRSSTPPDANGARASCSRARTSSCTRCGRAACSRSIPWPRSPTTRPSCSRCCSRCSRAAGSTCRSTPTSPRPSSPTSSVTPVRPRCSPTPSSPTSLARPRTKRACRRRGASPSAATSPVSPASTTCSRASPSRRPDDRVAGQFMQYTSGTTGRPKAVQRDLPKFDPETWVAAYSANLTRYDIEPGGDAVHLVTSPMYHLSPLNFGYFSLHLEHTVVLMEKWDAERALQLIDAHGVTDVAMVPTQLHRLMALPEDVRAKYDVSSLRQVIHAAAPCPVELKQRLFAWLGPVIYEFYGASEGGGTLARPEEWLAHPGTVGRPWVGCRRQGARRRRQRGAAGHRRHRLPEAHGRVRVQGRPGEDGSQPPRRLLHRRRHGRARRRRLPLPARPQDRHGRVGRREHLSRRGGGRAAVASRGRRRRRVRDPRRRLG